MTKCGGGNSSRLSAARLCGRRRTHILVFCVLLEESAMALAINVNGSTHSIESAMTRWIRHKFATGLRSPGFPASSLAAEALAAPRAKPPSARRKERISAMLCSVALLLSPGLGIAADIDANSFRCITKMTPVRQFYVDNLRGNLDATLAAANSATGAVYPPGSVLQLIPGEAMVKRDKGFDATTHDWEFFELDVSKDGTRVRKRGAADVVNRFGGNCFQCHIQAAPQWDLVCETDHGCAPIPVTPAMIRALQRTDPRCDNPINPEDAEAIKQLNEVLKPPG
jgi:hypothetical protein